eukprot:TRINITY_DN1487_c0_g2_i6.p1 TRINITY_DN1487_c0_g2~~TRINITY_DN1487_c0_g2_i6.p1  ORF type:complete len:575 (+),score=87.13 TRINITY_DN1487_c0_g2_i6:2-1726(+)
MGNTSSSCFGSPALLLPHDHMDSVMEDASSSLSSSSSSVAAGSSSAGDPKQLEEVLPIELVHFILSFLSLRCLTGLERVSSTWHRIVKSEDVWRQCHELTFGGPKRKKLKWRKWCIQSQQTYIKLTKPLPGTRRRTRPHVVWSLLQWCCIEGHHAMLRTVLRDFSDMTTEKFLNGEGHIVLPPLHCAAKRGHVKCIELLLDAVPDCASLLTNQHDWANTPVCFAACGGHADCVHLLLRRWLQVRQQQRQSGDSVTQYELILPVTYSLCIEGTQVWANDLEHTKGSIWPVFHQVARGGNVHLLQALVSQVLEEQATRRGSAVRQTPHSLLSRRDLWTEWEPIHHAAFNGHVAMVRYLLDQRNDINTPTNDVMLELVMNLVIDRGQLALLQNLLDDANIKYVQQNMDHWYSAVLKRRWWPGVREFVGRGSPVDMALFSGFRPLHLAVKAQSLSAVEYLLNKGANVNLPTAQNKSALELAMHPYQKGHMRDYIHNLPTARAIIELLVNAGADVKTAGLVDVLLGFDKYCWNAHAVSLLKYLLELGARIPTSPSLSLTLAKAPKAVSKLIQAAVDNKQ